MKKITLLVLLLLIALLLFGCQKQTDNTSETNAPETTGEKMAETNAPETTGDNSADTTGKLESETPKAETEKKPVESETPKAETETKPSETEPPIVKPIEPKPGYLPLLEETKSFIFCSGAGGWSTGLKLNADGTFSGEYHDSNMGETGDGYPNGTMYICSFTGKFENIEKINDYSYKMTLAYVNTERPSGQEWIEEGIKFISSGPYGIEGGKNFVLYLPGTPTSELHEEFFRWYLYCRSDPGSTLPVYGLRNVETNEGFF